VLSLDTRTCRTWARLLHRRDKAVLEDALVAATAIVHDLVVVTRDVRDFRGFGVQLLDPFTPSKSPRARLGARRARRPHPAFFMYSAHRRRRRRTRSRPITASVSKSGGVALRAVAPTRASMKISFGFQPILSA
jgi:hypothetical protein